MLIFIPKTEELHEDITKSKLYLERNLMLELIIEPIHIALKVCLLHNNIKFR